MAEPKPSNYRARREWQIAARARGEVPECGREACTSSVGRRPFVGSGTGVELEYCPACARRINEANGREVCTPKEVSVAEPTAEHIAEARDLFEGATFIDPYGRTIPLTVSAAVTEKFARALAAAEARGFERGRDRAAK